MSKNKTFYKRRFPSEWVQTLTIILTVTASCIGVTAWLDAKHRQDMSIMKQDFATLCKEDQERWKWLFDWAHSEIDGLKKRDK